MALCAEQGSVAAEDRRLLGLNPDGGAVRPPLARRSGNGNHAISRSRYGHSDCRANLNRLTFLCYLEVTFPITWERSGVRFPFAPTTVRHLNAFIIVTPQYSAEPRCSGRADNAGYIVTGLLFAGSTKSLPDTTAGCPGWMVRACGLRAARSGIGRTMAGRAPEMGARSHTLHPRKPAAQRRHLTSPVKGCRLPRTRPSRRAGVCSPAKAFEAGR